VWQILPATAGNEHIQNTVNGATVIGARATSASWVREKRTNEDPLALGEMNPAHAGMLLYLESVSKRSVTCVFE
jgi:hypothetical protein